mgnify:CR=1 FL=1
MLINELIIDWSRIEEGSYLRGIEALKELRSLRFKSPVTFFVGENGSGKSTFLEAMAVAYGFNPEGGTRNYHFSTFDSHSELHDAIRLSRGPVRAKWGYFLRAESFYNVATAEEGYADPGCSHEYHKKSHGESFLAVLQDNLNRDSIFFLDEPEAALSPSRQMVLLCEIMRYSKQGSQFVIATHSPILLTLPKAEILSFDNGRIHPCEYEDTDSYQITSMFINDRERILKQLRDE